MQLDFADASYLGKIPDLLTILELGIAIMVACSAVLRPVLDKAFRSIRAHGKSEARTSSLHYPDYSDDEMVHQSSFR